MRITHLVQALDCAIQMEVIFASLWSVGSWRGIYAGLRPYI